MWKELVKNEIWEFDNFLDNATIKEIKDDMTMAGKTELQPGEAILPNFRNSGVNATT